MKYLLLLILSFGWAVESFAQNQLKCGSHEAEKAILEKFPEFKHEIAHTNALLEGLQQGNFEKNARGNYIIPVVFHIIHNNGPENISETVITDAMKRINDDFNAANQDLANTIPEFVPLIANCGFEFKLATKDPNGQCTKGIDRIFSYKTYFADDQSKLNIWNPSRYLNIWVVNSIGSSGTAAYAYKPPTANSIFFYDGIICLYDYVGGIAPSQLNHQHTLSHEIGHWLNLDHTWGGTNQPGVSCGDDAVGDTPKTMGHDNCSTLYDDHCETGVWENIQNFMEYSYCSTMFTHGQKTRMEVSLNNLIAQRKWLWQSATHAYTGCLLPQPDCTPHADFRALRQYTCIGSPVNLNSLSWGDTALSHTWSAQNGTFNNSGNANTQITFITPGWQNVSLQVNSNAGNSQMNKTAYIYVSDNVAANPDNYIESFDSKYTWDKWPIFNYFENDFRWEFTEDAGLWGNRCLKYKGYDDRTFPKNLYLSASQDWDDVISPSYDLSNYTTGSAYLSFWSSSATSAGYPGAIDDSLQIHYSTNCGATWTPLRTLSGSNLHNMGSFSGKPYIPNSSLNWQLNQFALPNAALSNSTLFRLRFRPGDLSNNFYLDNWAIMRAPNTIGNPNALDAKLYIFPNPNKGQFDISLSQLPSYEKVELKISNLLGCIVYQNECYTSGSGMLQQKIDLGRNAPGIYVVEVICNESKNSLKVNIQ